VVPVAALKGIEVYALGVDGAEKSTSYWQSLKAFWSEYFAKAGATLGTYFQTVQFEELASCLDRQTHWVCIRCSSIIVGNPAG